MRAQGAPQGRPPPQPNPHVAALVLRAAPLADKLRTNPEEVQADCRNFINEAKRAPGIGPVDLDLIQRIELVPLLILLPKVFGRPLTAYICNATYTGGWMVHNSQFLAPLLLAFIVTNIYLTNPQVAFLFGLHPLNLTVQIQHRVTAIRSNIAGFPPFWAAQGQRLVQQEMNHLQLDRNREFVDFTRDLNWAAVFQVYRIPSKTYRQFRPLVTQRIDLNVQLTDHTFMLLRQICLNKQIVLRRDIDSRAQRQSVISTMTLFGVDLFYLLNFPLTRGNHWIVVHFRYAQKVVVIIDPLGIVTLTQRNLLRLKDDIQRAFLQDLLSFFKIQSFKITVETKRPNPSQSDQWSCGYYCAAYLFYSLGLAPPAMDLGRTMFIVNEYLVRRLAFMWPEQVPGEYVTVKVSQYQPKAAINRPVYQLREQYRYPDIQQAREEAVAQRMTQRRRSVFNQRRTFIDIEDSEPNRGPGPQIQEPSQELLVDPRLDVPIETVVVPKQYSQVPLHLVLTRVLQRNNFPVIENIGIITMHELPKDYQILMSQPAKSSIPGLPLQLGSLASTITLYSIDNNGQVFLFSRKFPQSKDKWWDYINPQDRGYSQASVKGFQATQSTLLAMKKINRVNLIPKTQRPKNNVVQTVSSLGYKWSDIIMVNTRMIQWNIKINRKSPWDSFSYLDPKTYQQMWIQDNKIDKLPFVLQRRQRDAVLRITQQVEQGTYLGQLVGDLQPSSVVYKLNETIYPLGYCGWEYICVTPQIYANHFKFAEPSTQPNCTIHRLLHAREGARQNKKGYVHCQLILAVVANRRIEQGQILSFSSQVQIEEEVPIPQPVNYMEFNPQPRVPQPDYVIDDMISQSQSLDLTGFLHMSNQPSSGFQRAIEQQVPGESVQQALQQQYEIPPEHEVDQQPERRQPEPIEQIYEMHQAQPRAQPAAQQRRPDPQRAAVGQDQLPPMDDQRPYHYKNLIGDLAHMLQAVQPNYVNIQDDVLQTSMAYREMVARSFEWNQIPAHFVRTIGRELLQYQLNWSTQFNAGRRGPHRPQFIVEPRRFARTERRGQEPFWQWVAATRRRRKVAKLQTTQIHRDSQTFDAYDFTNVAFSPIVRNFLNGIFGRATVMVPEDAFWARQVVQPVWSTIAEIFVRKIQLLYLAREFLQVTGLTEATSVFYTTVTQGLTNMDALIYIELTLDEKAIQTSLPVKINTDWNLPLLFAIDQPRFIAWADQTLWTIIRELQRVMMGWLIKYTKKLRSGAYQSDAEIQAGLESGEIEWQAIIQTSMTSLRIDEVVGAMVSDNNQLMGGRQRPAPERVDQIQALISRIRNINGIRDRLRLSWNVLSDQQYWHEVELPQYSKFLEQSDQTNCLVNLATFLLGTNDLPESLMTAILYKKTCFVLKEIAKTQKLNFYYRDSQSSQFVRYVVNNEAKYEVVQFTGHITIIDPQFVQKVTKFKKHSPPSKQNKSLARSQHKPKSYAQRQTRYTYRDFSNIQLTDNPFYHKVHSPYFRRNSIFVDIQCIDTRIQRCVSVAVYGWLANKNEVVEEIFFSNELIDDPVEQFVRWLISMNNAQMVSNQRTPIYVWTFNGNRYDNKYFLPKLVKYFSKVKSFGGMAQSKGLVLNSGQIIFRDAVLIYPGQSLKKACNTYNVFNKKTTIEGLGQVSNMKTWQDYVDNKEAVLAYNMQDCKCTAQLVERFYLSLYQLFQDSKKHFKVAVQNYSFMDIYNAVWTCPQVAMLFYTEIFIGDEQNVGLSREQDPLIQLQRQFYRGGLVQVFRPFSQETLDERSQTNIYKFDINSSYPYSMTGPLPFYYERKVNRMQWQNGLPSNPLQYELWFFKVKSIKFPAKNAIPFIPLVRANGSYYPQEVDQEVCLWGSQIELMKKMKAQFEIIEVHAYSDTKNGVVNNSIRNYVNYFYPKKSEEKDETKKTLVKLLLNSLYGKFGQQLNDDVNFWDQSHYRCQSDNSKLLSMIYRGDFVEVTEQSKIPQTHVGYLVRLASCITARSRVNIIAYALKAGPTNLFYIDTDSLDVNRLGYQSLMRYPEIIHEKKLGCLKLQRQVLSAIYLSRKNYMHLIKVNGQFVAVWKGKGYNHKWDDNYSVVMFHRLKHKLQQLFDKTETYQNQFNYNAKLPVDSLPTGCISVCTRFIAQRDGSGIRVEQYNKEINVVIKRVPYRSQTGQRRYIPPLTPQIPK